MTELNETTPAPEATEGISEDTRAPEGVVVPETPSEVTEGPTERHGEHAEDQPGQDEEPAGPLAKVRREAAGLRGRLRDTEAERDALAERVAHLQRAEVARLASGTLAEGGDIWIAGVELAEVLNEDGNVDPDLVAAAAERVVAERPHWRSKFVPRGAPDNSNKPEPGTPEWGQFLSKLHAGASGDAPAPEQASWGGLLRGR